MLLSFEMLLDTVIHSSELDRTKFRSDCITD